MTCANSSKIPTEDVTIQAQRVILRVLNLGTLSVLDTNSILEMFSSLETGDVRQMLL